MDIKVIDLQSFVGGRAGERAEEDSQGNQLRKKLSPIEWNQNQKLEKCKKLYNRTKNYASLPRFMANLLS